MMNTRKACWTCKDRKVLCDRGAPTCGNCARAQRECQGYGLRLSWPRDNDKRRAITGKPSVDAAHGSQRETHHRLFVNATGWDIELYRYLALQRLARPPRLIQPTPDLWRPPRRKVEDVDLIQYFHDVAHRSLGTFAPTPSHIRDLLLCMALANRTVPAQALLYAIFAVSSLHRSGFHQEALQFKVLALNGLSTSAKAGSLGSAEAALHVATCMLLCIFEIWVPTESSGEWFCYVRGAMDIIHGSHLEQKSDESDIRDLLDWVYYHNVLAQFAMHHWRHKSVAVDVKDADHPEPQGVRYSALAKDTPALHSSNPALAILDLLSEACNTLLDPRDCKSRDQEYIDRIRRLECRIESLPAGPLPSLAPDRPSPDTSMSAEVYRMATLIYLKRASQSPLEPSSEKLDSLVNTAFALFGMPVESCCCHHYFPMLILGCEARTDEQRVAVLNLIESTERRTHVRSMKRLAAGIQSIWVQQDLHSDSDLVVNYLAMMNAIVSSNDTLPSFV
ncbi:Zinc-finger transcription factor [Pleurostoma richardsiae]|uniref:Zinc-finger transcription factor n=1 Tax=Pleurostoma richardsiae TaxID=41990 RepID=A0AA38VW36_9PEZI|nr:Zinc-finger transcription factor [Pleurostoma richardsiae]